MPDLAGFQYRFEEGPSDRTLLLLHGTGADENDLIPLGRALDATAGLLSPRGQVLEGGMPRFFRRLAEGVFDVDDLKTRTHGLVDFVDAAAKDMGFDRSKVVAAGFSNGANIATAALLMRGRVFQGAILLRPMVPLEPDDVPNLSGMRIFVGAGLSDPLIPLEQTERLAEMLRRAGANVELVLNPGGHQLQMEEVETARVWLAR